MSSSALWRPRRLFRADSTSDVVCATLVAETLPPGGSVLAVSVDKYAADAEPLRECLAALSRLHDWDAVVDISGLPINRHVMGTSKPASRRSVLHDTLRSAEVLRQRLAETFGVQTDVDFAVALDAAVAELYVTCVYHPDVQALIRILPSAQTFYYPHGFGCLASSELLYYEEFLRERRRSPAMLLKDVTRRLVWGLDAVPLRTVRLDGAYSFNLAMPAPTRHYSLGHLENRTTMERLFGRLPLSVQTYYRTLAETCDHQTGLLMVSGQSGTDVGGEAAEVEAHIHVARSMTIRHELTSLLVKPHPMGSSTWSDRIIAVLRSELPNVELKIIENYGHYPIELVLVPFPIATAATVLSNSLRNLRRIYGIQCYCPESRLLDVWRRTRHGAIAEEWVAESREHYIAV